MVLGQPIFQVFLAAFDDIIHKSTHIIFNLLILQEQLLSNVPCIYGLTCEVRLFVLTFGNS